MEHRVVLINRGTFKIQKGVKIPPTVFIKDESKGTKRYRRDDDGKRVKVYVTPVIR